jgi:hypothetical protein
LFKPAESFNKEFNNFPELASAKLKTLKGVDDSEGQFVEENGLSHSPPYAYRILLPILVFFLGFLGITNETGFFLISALATGVTGVCTFLLLKKSQLSNWSILLYILAFTFGALSAIPNPIYTDYLVLCLLLLIIYYELNGNYRLALGISALAVLTRETSLFLWFAIVIGLPGLGRKRITKHNMAYLFLAPLGFLITRIIVHIPKSSYPLMDLARQRMNTGVIYSILIFIFLALASTPVLFLFVTSQWKTMNRIDSYQFGIGIAGFAFASIFGWNWIRFLVIFWPMLIFYRTLKFLPKRDIHLLISSLGIGFLGIDDFLVTNQKFQLTSLILGEITLLISANLLLAYSNNRSKS